jgi:hypothetical protein
MDRSGALAERCEHVSEPQEPLRAELTQAMAEIREQLERLRSGPLIGEPLNNRSVIADLEAEYDSLQRARDGLAPLNP